MKSIRPSRKPMKAVFFTVLLLGVVAGGVWFYMLRPPAPEAGQTDQSTLSSQQEGSSEQLVEKAPVDSDKLVKTSFNDYFSSTMKPETDNKDALAAFKQSVTDEVAAQIDGQEVVDPILCTFDTPTKITFGKPTKEGSSTKIVITTYFEGGTVQTAVSINETSGKITNLQCLTTGG